MRFLFLLMSLVAELCGKLQRDDGGSVYIYVSVF